MWHRIFCRSETEVTPAELLEHLHTSGFAVRGDFRGDDLGWTTAVLTLPAGGSPVMVERYLSSEDEIRRELNAWAAWLETADYSENHQSLMEWVIQTKQLVSLRRPVDHADEATLDDVCVATCRFVAGKTDGVYQIDEQGFFDANGALLLQEY